MTEQRQRIAQVLDRLVRLEGVEGVELIERDGQCLAEAYPPDLDLQDFSRRSAALALAGESVLPELRASASRRLVTRADRKGVVVVRANERLLLAALTKADRPGDAVLQHVEAAAADIGRIAHHAA